MNDFIRDKLYSYINVLDESILIKRLDESKKEMQENKEVKELIDKYNKEKEMNIDIKSSKQELYNNDLVKEYLKYENELNYIILDLNSNLKKLIDKKGCR